MNERFIEGLHRLMIWHNSATRSFVTPSPDLPFSNPGSDWWRQASVYQIYPRGVPDSNGDGIGDIPGIVSRVDHSSELGIDAIWLSPFYPSPLADGGYDVSDYRDVDPRLGTLAEFSQLIEEAQRRGIRSHHRHRDESHI